jgi:hypothetical protein
VAIGLPFGSRICSSNGYPNEPDVYQFKRKSIVETLQTAKRYMFQLTIGIKMAGHHDARYIPPRRKGEFSPPSAQQLCRSVACTGGLHDRHNRLGGIHSHLLARAS